MGARRITALGYRPQGRPSARGEDLGELVAIRGANRSGKSTLARRLCGADAAAVGDELELGYDGAPPAADRSADTTPLLISLAGLDPITLVGTASPSGTAPGDSWRRAGWLARIETTRAALVHAPAPAPAWLRAAAPPPPPPPPPAAGPLLPAPPASVPAAPAAHQLAERVAQLDAAIAAARACIDAAQVPDEAAIRSALASLSELDHPAPVEAALPELGAFLCSSRRHFPALVLSVGALVVLAGLLMAAGLSHVAAPLALLAVSAALLVLLAPPLRREQPVGHGLAGLARALIDDNELGSGQAPTPAAEHRRDVLARLALPADLDDDGVAAYRGRLERRLDAQRRTPALQRDLQQLVADRTRLLEAVPSPPAAPAAAGPGPVATRHLPPPTGAPVGNVPAPSAAGAVPAPSAAVDAWTDLLDRRRELIRANLATAQAVRAEAEAERTAAALRELDRLRHQLSDTFDAAVVELAGRLLLRCSAGRLRALLVDDEIRVAGVDGAWHPLRRLARTDQQLAGLALQLARAEHLQPEQPLVLDDVLVGLDERNLQAVCATLANLAEHRQIFVLTSSVAVTDALRRARRSTRVLELR